MSFLDRGFLVDWPGWMKSSGISVGSSRFSCKISNPAFLAFNKSLVLSPLKVIVGSRSLNILLKNEGDKKLGILLKVE
jgi:hypothetical protein